MGAWLHVRGIIVVATVSYLPKIIQEPLPAPSAKPMAKPAARQEPQRCTQHLEIGPLVFRCPATGQSIESGIEMDSQTFRRIGQLSVHLRCPACRLPHQLEVADGGLAPY